MFLKTLWPTFAVVTAFVFGGRLRSHMPERPVRHCSARLKPAPVIAVPMEYKPRLVILPTVTNA